MAEAIHETREGWLLAAAEELRPMLAERTGLEAPVARIGVGFTSKGARSTTRGQCWASSASGDKVPEITIRVSVTDAGTVLGILLHELIHAALDCQHGHSGPFKKAHKALGFTGTAKTSEQGDDLKAELLTIAERLGAYPGAEFKGGAVSTSAGAKQTTRMIKCECRDCGFLFRTTRQWIDTAGDELSCPSVGCGGDVAVAA